MCIPQSDLLLPEFDQEMANTRTLLERVPAADAAWRPHPKSYTLGDLALHTVNIASWLTPTLTLTELDLNPPEGPAWTPPVFTTVPALLALFDGNVREGRAALAGASDAALEVPWTLKSGGKAIFTLPRRVVVRSFVLSHHIHHRAQLEVYLRLRDVPLPGIYGPSADMGG